MYKCTYYFDLDVSKVHIHCSKCTLGSHISFPNTDINGRLSTLEVKCDVFVHKYHIYPLIICTKYDFNRFNLYLLIHKYMNIK